MTDAAGTEHHAYVFDASGQLTQEKYLPSSGGAVTRGYEYDAAGNRTAITGAPVPSVFTYDGGSRLTQLSDGSGVNVFRYDDAGRLTSVIGSKAAAYSWSADHHLVQASRNGAIVSFKHDADGNIWQRKSATLTLDHRYDRGRLEAITDVLGATYASFTYDADGTPRSIAIPSAGTFYYHYDALGSVERITSSTGALAARFVYDAAGNVADSIPGPAWSASLDRNPFGFLARSGAHFLPDLGLYKVGSLYYDPAIGRYLSRDGAGSYRPCWWSAPCPPAAEAVGEIHASDEDPYVQPQLCRTSTLTTNTPIGGSPARGKILVDIDVQCTTEIPYINPEFLEIKIDGDATWILENSTLGSSGFWNCEPNEGRPCTAVEPLREMHRSCALGGSTPCTALHSQSNPRYCGGADDPLRCPTKPGAVEPVHLYATSRSYFRYDVVVQADFPQPIGGVKGSARTEYRTSRDQRCGTVVRNEVNPLDPGSRVVCYTEHRVPRL